MLTVCRRFHSYEAIEIVLHQDSKGFRTGFDGVLQMCNTPSKILIRGIGVYRGKKRLRVEGFRCYENCGLCQATTGISESALASNSGKTRKCHTCVHVQISQSREYTPLSFSSVQSYRRLESEDQPHFVSKSEWIAFALVACRGAEKRARDRVFEFMVYFFPLAIPTISLMGYQDLELVR